MAKPSPSCTPLSRRQEYAAATRAAVIQSARELFAQNGFIATTVEEIAARARVAPATVYSSVGGKHAVLAVLLEELAAWQPRDETFDRIAAAKTGHEVLAALAHGTRVTREEWADVIRVIGETAPHDKQAAAAQSLRLRRYRKALSVVVDQLEAIAVPGPDRERAADILWFYFGPAAYIPLHEERGWSYSETEKWLLEQCEKALCLG